MNKDITGASWYVDINKVRTDYPRTENLAQFLIEEVPYFQSIIPPTLNSGQENPKDVSKGYGERCLASGATCLEICIFLVITAS